MPARLVIEPQGRRKGRSFSATLLAFATANKLWSAGSTDVGRPCFIAFASTDQEVRALAANLRTGRRAKVVNEHSWTEETIAFRKADGMRWHFQKNAHGTVVTGYLPELFELDPGMLPPRVRFIFAPPIWWVERQLAAHPETDRESVVASYFAAYLDRRTAVPLVNDPVFHRRLWRAAQQRDWYSTPGGNLPARARLYLWPKGSAAPPGMELLASVDASHEQVEEFVREQTRAYFESDSPSWHLEPRAEVTAPAPVAGRPSNGPEDETVTEPEEIPTTPIPRALPAAARQLSLLDLADLL
jgi:hypothetical protein